MWGDNRGWTLLLDEASLWIMDTYFGQKWRLKLKCLDDEVVSYKHVAFTLQDVNWLI